MKVLHIPRNIASQTSITVRALREIGVNVRGLVKHHSLIQDNDGIETLPEKNSDQNSIGRFRRKASLINLVFEAIKWADVIHWHGNTRILPMELDLKYIKFMRKASLVEFWGSDIRIPQIASADNPYLAQMYELTSFDAEYRKIKSIKSQSLFAKYGFECLVPDGEMEGYIQKNIWPHHYRTRQRLILSDFIPQYPDPLQKCPLIVHPPSHKGMKGTDVILRAIEELKKTHHFEFKLIHGVEHRKAKELIGKADIVIDQVVFGAHGLLALEAMSLGKPTVCYIKPSLIPTYPKELPIVNASQDTIEQVLAQLLGDGRRRHEIGRQSRAYVEEYHDAHKIAKDLVGIYQELLMKKRGLRDTCPLR